MRKKFIIIGACIFLAVFVVFAAIFFSHDQGKVEPLFEQTVKALDTKEGLKELFLPEVAENSKTFDEDIEAVYDFYNGKSVEVKDFNIFRETATGYRMYANVVTDDKSYFVCLNVTGARKVDTVGIKQFIIQDSEEFANKKIINFEKEKIKDYEKFNKYTAHAKEYGATIRVKGDR